MCFEWSFRNFLVWCGFVSRYLRSGVHVYSTWIRLLEIAYLKVRMRTTVCTPQCTLRLCILLHKEYRTEIYWKPSFDKSCSLMAIKMTCLAKFPARASSRSGKHFYSIPVFCAMRTASDYLASENLSINSLNPLQSPLAPLSLDAHILKKININFKICLGYNNSSLQKWQPINNSSS